MLCLGYSKLVRLQISQWQHCFIPSSATLLLFRVFSHFSFMPNVQYVQSVKYCLLLQRHFNSCKTSLTLQLPLYLCENYLNLRPFYGHISVETTIAISLLRACDVLLRSLMQKSIEMQRRIDLSTIKTLSWKISVEIDFFVYTQHKLLIILLVSKIKIIYRNNFEYPVNTNEHARTKSETNLCFSRTNRIAYKFVEKEKSAALMWRHFRGLRYKLFIHFMPMCAQVGWKWKKAQCELIESNLKLIKLIILQISH